MASFLGSRSNSSGSLLQQGNMAPGLGMHDNNMLRSSSFGIGDAHSNSLRQQLMMNQMSGES